MNLMSPLEATIKTFNDTVEEYTKLTDPLAPLELVEKFTSYLNPGAKILDVGCGPGRDGAEFARMGFEVTGIDASKKMIEAAKKRSPKSEFSVMDMRALGFDDDTFDGAWACASIFFVPKSEIPKVLSEIYRVLKSGGVLYAGLKEGEGEGLQKDERYENREKYYSFFRKDEIVSVMEKIGFSEFDVEVKTVENNYNRKNYINIFCKK